MYKISIIKNWNADIISQLEDIWIEAFGDQKDYVDFFLSHLPENVKIVLAMDGTRIISVIYLFPLWIMPGNIPAYYGYAGAVRREYQGYCVYPDMMNFTIDFVNRENAQFIVSAAETRMIRPFRHLGLKEIYQCIEDTFVRSDFSEDIKPLKRRGLSINEWKTMRPRLSENQYYMVPDDEWLCCLMDLKKYCGNIWESVRLNGAWHSVIGYYEGDVLIIDESSAPRELLLKNATALCETYNINRLKLRFPVTKMKGEESTIYNAQGTFDKGYLWASLID